MSAYITLMTPMTDEECLLAALADVGFDRTKVEVHVNPVRLMGYQVDRQIREANLVIRRQHVGSVYNDVGFLATPTGYQAFVSDDDPRFGAGWLERLNQQYQLHAEAKQQRMAEEERQHLEAERKKLVEAQRATICAKAKKLGYQVKETRAGESIRLVLVKRTY